MNATERPWSALEGISTGVSDALRPERFTFQDDDIMHKLKASSTYNKRKISAFREALMSSNPSNNSNPQDSSLIASGSEPFAHGEHRR